MKEIEIIIDANGEASIDLKGYHGKGCSNIAEALSKALGQTVKSDKKCEFYQGTNITQKQQEKQQIRNK